MQKIDDALNIKPTIEVEWEIYLKLVKKFTYNNKSHCTIQHVIDWFRDNVREHGLHRLNFLALSLAPIKLTSANDERVFSFTGKTSSGQRGGMSATKLEQLTIVGKNWDLCPGHIVRDRRTLEKEIASCEGCCGKEYNAERAKQEPLEGLDGSLQEDV